MKLSHTTIESFEVRDTAENVSVWIVMMSLFTVYKAESSVPYGSKCSVFKSICISSCDAISIVTGQYF